MTRRIGAVVVVGESVAGTSAVRELRSHGYGGSITLIGDEPEGAYSRPPLSKQVLKDPVVDDAAGPAGSALPTDVQVVRHAATSLDVDSRTVVTADGRRHRYDALVVATGARARRLARADQSGEAVLRTLEDARALRSRMARATSAIVVGAGFLGMEVATACVEQGISVTVVDLQPPVTRVLGEDLSALISARAAEHGIAFVQVGGPIHLVGDPVEAIRTPDGRVLHADLVITCAGDTPNTEWLAGTGLADPLGVPIAAGAATGVAGVFAAGDVAYVRGARARRPYWSNAAAQGRAAAASILGRTPGPIEDNYFWTEILGVSIKACGPLPVTGPPEVLEGSADDHHALLQWVDGLGRRTVVAYGVRKSVRLLRTLAG